jgi:hypothetical protein
MVARAGGGVDLIAGGAVNEWAGESGAPRDARDFGW